MIPNLSASDLDTIHQASMRLLDEIGVRFPADTALQLLRRQGVRVDGHTAHFSESQIMAALSTVPKTFTIHARNSSRSVVVGDGTPTFAPGYGAPLLVDHSVGMRKPTSDDYDRIARLAHALPNQDLCGHLMIEPTDIPTRNAHLHMLRMSVRHSDKPFIGSSAGGRGAQHTLDVATILFGHTNVPVTLALINPLSPLSYSSAMTDAMMLYAQAGQPMVIASLVMAGTSGPITLAGVLAQQNAELLAGIALAQMVNPGVPVVYGSASTNTDMCLGTPSFGSPELSLLIGAHAQLARYYGLLSRAGGALTDACGCDAQAGWESMLSLTATVQSGIDFVLHSAGIVAGYMAFSAEKFVIDDEMCGIMRHFSRGIDVTPETLAHDVIANVWSGGNFLAETHTAERCRNEFWAPEVADRASVYVWMENGRPEAAERAASRCEALLDSHIDPPMDALTTRLLDDFVNKHCSL